jgi:hypothetical protein
MKLKGWRLAPLLALALLFMIGCASTQDQKAEMDKRQLCSVLDTDRDGKITKEEFMAKATDKEKALKVYQECDNDRSGHLSYDEVLNPRGMVPMELFMTPPPVLVPRR